MGEKQPEKSDSNSGPLDLVLASSGPSHSSLTDCDSVIDEGFSPLILIEERTHVPFWDVRFGT